MSMLTLMLLTSLTAVSPDAHELCRTPQRAARTFLDNLQPGRMNPERASLCAQVPKGLDAISLQRRVKELKRIFDVSGYIISIEKLPDQSDYTDEKTGRAEVVLHTALPAVILVHDDVGWRFPARVIQAVPRLSSSAMVWDLSALTAHLPDWMQQKIFGIAGWQVLYLVVLIAVGFLLRTLVTWFVAGWARRLMDRLKITWGRDLLQNASQPLGTLALAGLLGLGVPGAGLSVGWAAVAMIAVRMIAALAAVMVLYRVVDLFSAYLESKAKATETKLDDQLVPLVRKALRVLVIAMGTVFVLQNLDVDVGSLIAGLGLGGLAFALAAKDTVANFFGSITIFLDKPFQIGDWVTAAGVEGVVEEVGFRSTRIRTFYNSLVSVPNAKIADAVIDNYGLRTYRRTLATLGLTYSTSPEQVEAFCDGVRAIIKAHPATRKDYYEVHFTGYGASSLDIMLYFFFEVPSWSDELRGRHEIYLDILRLAEKLGVSFAFPTQTLHVESQAMPQAVDKIEAPQPAWLKQRVLDFAPGGAAVIPPGPRVTSGFFAGESGAGDGQDSQDKQD